MANYVLAFRGDADRTPGDDENAVWASWFQSLGSAVIDFGHQVGRVRTLGDASGAQGEGQLTGYVVITADNLDGAVRLAAGCPGLSSGVRVEVAETVEN